MAEVYLYEDRAYNLSSDANTFLSRSIRTTYNGKKSIQSLAPKIWEQVPENMKNFVTLNN